MNGEPTPHFIVLLEHLFSFIIDNIPCQGARSAEMAAIVALVCFSICVAALALLALRVLPKGVRSVVSSVLLLVAFTTVLACIGRATQPAMSWQTIFIGALVVAVLALAGLYVLASSGGSHSKIWLSALAVALCVIAGIFMVTFIRSGNSDILAAITSCG